MEQNKDIAIPRNDMRQAMHDMRRAAPPMKKQIVMYAPSEDDYIALGRCAFIRVFDDKGYTCTTQVLYYDIDTDVFETAYTIYKPSK
jgi:hypothetical protein